MIYNQIMSSDNHTPLQLVSKPVEAEPARATETQEVVYHEVVEHQPKTELPPYVQTRKESIKLPEDLKQETGAEEASPTQFTSYQTVKLPITDEKIEEGLKHPVTSSFRWLSEFYLYLLHQAHLTLKNIKGRVVRVRE